MALVDLRYYKDSPDDRCQYEDCQFLISFLVRSPRRFTFVHKHDARKKFLHLIIAVYRYLEKPIVLKHIIFLYSGAAGDPPDGARLQLQLRQVLQAAEGQEGRRGALQHRRQKCVHQGTLHRPACPHKGSSESRRAFYANIE